jgi:autotransporter-associated beta strand protein
VPAAGTDLTFGSNGVQAMTNTIPQGRVFRSLTFSRAGFQVTQNGIGLNNPAGVALRTTHAGGTTGIGLPVTLSGGAQTFEVRNGGTLDFLTNSGGINLNGQNLTLATPHPDSRVINRTAISGTGNLTKTGAGTWALDNAHSYVGTTTVQAGTLEVMAFGQLNSTGTVVISNGARLTGSGILTLTGGDLEYAGTIEPGTFADPLARLRLQGNLIATTTAAGLVFELQNPSAAGLSYDQIQVTTGGVIPAGAAVTLVPSAIQAYGAAFVLINKVSAGAISGTFGGLPEGGIRNFGLNGYRFSYTGGDGNDFTATAGAAAPSGTTRTWAAGGATAHWSDAANWDSPTLPAAGDILRFTAAAFQNSINDRGGAYHRLEFAGEGFHSLGASGTNANPLTLTDGIVSTQTFGSATITNSLDLGADQTFATGAGTLTFLSGGQIRLHGHTLTLATNQTGVGGITVFSLLTGTGNLVKTGPGVAEISGAGAGVNDFSGTTTVLEGELRLSRPTPGLAAITGDIAIGGGPGAALVSTSVAEKIADPATISIAADGTFAPGATETVAALELAGGSVTTGPNLLAVTQIVSQSGALPAAITGRLRLAGSGQQTLQVAGTGALVIAADVDRAGAQEWLKTGPGTAVLGGTVATGAIEVAAGTLRINGDAGATEIRPLAGATVAGTGTLGALNIKGGTLSPGGGGAGGALHCSGPVANEGNGFVFRAILDGTASAPLVCADKVDIDGGELDVREITVPPLFAKLTILRNDGPDPVSGRFRQHGVRLDEGALVIGQGGHYHITYAGGPGGRDVELVAVPVTATGTTRTWAGGGGLGNRRWSNPANWSGGMVPQPGDAVVFPAGSVFLSTVQDLPSGLTLASLAVSGSSPDTLDFNGNALALVAGFSCSMDDSAGRFINFNLPLTLAGAAPEIAVTGIRPVKVTAPLAHLGASLTVRGNGIADPGPFGGLQVLAPVSGTFATTLTDSVGLRLASGVPQPFSGPVTVESGSLSTLGAAQINGTLSVGGDPSRPAVAALTVNALGGFQNVVVLANGTLTGPSNPVEELALDGGSATLTGIWQVRSRVAVASGSLDASAASLSFPVTDPPGPGLRRIDLAPAAVVAVQRLFSGPAIPVQVTGGTLVVTEQLTANPLVASGATVECNATEPPFANLMLAGGILTGSGRVATVTADPAVPGNRIAPGSGTAPHASLSIAGLAAPVGAHLLELTFRLSGLSPGAPHSQLVLLASAPAPALDGCSVTHSLPAMINPLEVPGASFVLLENQTATVFPAVPPTRPEGHLTPAGPWLLRTSYYGGSGNDLTLGVLADAPLPQPRLTSFAVQPPGAGGPGSPASFSGTLAGGLPGSAVFIEASGDLGLADPWRLLRVVVLDAAGAATVPVTPDPALGPHGFFRARLP